MAGTLPPPSLSSLNRVSSQTCLLVPFLIFHPGRPPPFITPFFFSLSTFFILVREWNFSPRQKTIISPLIERNRSPPPFLACRLASILWTGTHPPVLQVRAFQNKLKSRRGISLVPSEFPLPFGLFIYVLQVLVGRDRRLSFRAAIDSDSIPYPLGFFLAFLFFGQPLFLSSLFGLPDFSPAHFTSTANSPFLVWDLLTRFSTRSCFLYSCSRKFSFFLSKTEGDPMIKRL